MCEVRHTKKHVKMQCKTRTLKTVKKLSVERWTLQIVSEHHIVINFSAFKMAEGTTATGFLTPWRLCMSPYCANTSYTCFCTKHHYGGRVDYI